MFFPKLRVQVKIKSYMHTCQLSEISKSEITHENPTQQQFLVHSFRGGKLGMEFKSEIVCQSAVLVCHQLVKTYFNYIKVDYCNT